jgi:hypothetical protein
LIWSSSSICAWLCVGMADVAADLFVASVSSYAMVWRHRLFYVLFRGVIGDFPLSRLSLAVRASKRRLPPLPLFTPRTQILSLFVVVLELLVEFYVAVTGNGLRGC